MGKLIGRESEKKILEGALKSSRPELIVVYGRRRIGKTFLIDQVYKNHIQFRFSGIHGASLKEQLSNFHLLLSDKRPMLNEPKSWIEAFHHLGKYFDTLKSKKKKVLFIDEFPWLDSRRSKFLPAFDNFWNNYASKREDIIVVVCGSAASYMIQKIVKSKGGLHNRLTQRIQLSPFDLYETEELLKSIGVTKLNRYQIVQLYMTMGGIPHYLEKIVPGESVPQVIDRLCFQKNGFLRTEFDNVFASLFEQYENHEIVVRALASVRKGLTRNQLLSKIKKNSGGRLTKTLLELEQSGFIENYLPYDGIKNSIYRLSDEYSMFYIKYIEKTKPSSRPLWSKMAGKPSYKIWCGYSFETTCIKHIEQIKEGLKISGIHSIHGSWIEKKDGNGAQIDLLIDRDDDVINLCEMKFYDAPYTLNKKYAHEIAKKTNVFIESAKTRKSIFVTFITANGLTPNSYAKQYVQNELTIEDLFKKL